MSLLKYEQMRSTIHMSKPGEDCGLAIASVGFAEEEKNHNLRRGRPDVVELTIV